MIPENESPCVMTNVHFQALIHEGIDLAERWKLSGIYSTPEGINASVFREFADLMLSPVSGSYRYIQSMIYALLWKVGSVKQVASAGNWRKLEPALILIERRLSDPDLSCGDLAAAAGLSVVYCRQLSAANSAFPRWLTCIAFGFSTPNSCFARRFFPSRRLRSRRALPTLTFFIASSSARPEPRRPHFVLIRLEGPPEKAAFYTRKK